MCNMIFSLKGYTREYMMLQMDGIGVDYTGFNINFKNQNWNISFYFREKRTVGVRDTGWFHIWNENCKIINLPYRCGTSTWSTWLTQVRQRSGLCLDGWHSSHNLRFIELKLSGISSTICSGPSFSKLLSWWSDISPSILRYQTLRWVS